MNNWSITKEQLDAHARNLVEAGKNPESDRFFQSMKQFYDLNVTFQTTGDVQTGGLRAQTLNARNLYQAQSKAPLSKNWSTVVSSPKDDFGLVVGAFEATQERLDQERKNRGYSWEAEVQVVLSNNLRNRCVGVTLFSPQVKRPDLTVRTLGDHMEDMKERNKFASRSVGSWKYLLEEHDRIREINPSTGRPYVSGRQADRIITADGLMRLLADEVSNYSDPRIGQAGGDIMIRLQLERAAGIVFRTRHLKMEPFDLFIMSWIQDMIEFTASNRNRFWDQRLRMFVDSGSRERPPATPMEQIWKEMSQI